ncbi:MAG: asparagine synthase C-terminal domain-containing protein, partial [Acidobacteriota bacterium]
TGGNPGRSFSISFTDEEISEARYQRLMAERLGSEHHEIRFDWREISDRLQSMLYHCECPLKETFDTCAMALSEAARRTGVPVILAGQGADELFAGYMGYRFDQAAIRDEAAFDLDAALEAEARETLWGDPDLFYEIDFVPLRDIKATLYAPELAEALHEFDCTTHPVIDPRRLHGRHPVHQRSYLDVKLRLGEHLLSEHGDRMVMANSVEGRYPFLDRDLVDFATRIPPELKLNRLVEKYVIKRVAEGLVPREIIEREKFGFRAPGTPYLLQQKVEWVEDFLSYDRIRSQGYFNADFVEQLKSRYRTPGFVLNAHLEIDYLMIVLTFSILVDLFELPVQQPMRLATA